MHISPSGSPIIAAALESSGTVVVTFDVVDEAPTRPRIADVNRAFLQFCGYAPEEITGFGLDFIASVESPAWQAITKAFAGYQSYRGELACTAKDGTTKWLGLHLMPVTNPATQTCHYVLIGRDITVQRRQGAQSKLIQGLLLKSFMLADRAMAVVMESDVIMMANPMLDAMVGAAPGSLTGQNFGELIAPPYRQLVRDAQAENTEEGDSFHVDMEFLCAGGAKVPITGRFVRIEYSGQQGVMIASFVPPPQGTDLPVQMRMASRLRFVDMAAVRSALKGRWEKVGARVMESSEQFIARQLQPGDVLSRSEDRGFSICFAHAGDDEATEIAAAIARNLREHLIGKGEPEEFVQMSALTCKIATAAGKPPNMPSIGRHLDAAEAELQNTPWPAPQPTQAILTADGKPAATLVRLLPPITTSATLAFPESSLLAEMAALKVAQTLEVQHWVLVDVGFETFMRRASTDAYIEACLTLPVPLRERLYPVFSPLPKGTTQSLVQDLMRRMGRACAGFALRIEDLKQPEFDLAICRPAAAVIDVRRWDGGNSVPADRLKRLTSLMHAYRVRVLAVNVASQETGQNLMRMGVDWVALDR